MKRIMEKIYLASPFFNETQIKNVQTTANKLRSLGYEVFVPMEHKIPNGENLKNDDWGNKVFHMDVAAINDCDIVVVLYYGMDSDSGTSWEQGYAYATNKKIYVIDYTNDLCNLMNYFGCSKVIMPNFEDLDNAQESKSEVK